MPPDSFDSGMGPGSRNPFFSVLPGIVLPMFLAAVDGTIVATALPAIAASLGEVERVSWVVVAYLVAATIAAPVYGRLGDSFGRRRMLLAAVGVMLVACLLCAAAPTVTALILARILQGFGGGGMMTLVQALVGEVVPPRERGRYQGYLATVFVASSMAGPVAGGWLTQQFGWQAVFLANVPLGLLAAVLALRLPHRPAGPGHFRFDVLGLVLFAGFIAPVMLALERLRRFEAEAAVVGVALLAVAAGSFVLLLRQERRAATPLLPVTFLRQAAVWRTNALGMMHGATLVSLVTFLPIYLQVARGATPAEAGLLLLPLTVVVSFGSMATGRLVTQTGRTALWPSLGLPVGAASLAGLALFAPVMPVAQIPWVLAVTAFFLGTTMPVVQVTVQTLAGPKQLGAAAAAVQFSRSIGAATGTAVVGAVLFAVLAATDPETAALFGRIVQEGPGALAGLPAARLGVMQAEITSAFRAAFLAIAGFALAGSVLAWSIPVRRIG